MVLLLILVLAVLAAPASAITDAELDRASRQEAAEVEARYGVSHDPQLVDRVRSVFRRVANAARRTQWPLQIRVLDTGEVNAFALPNGMVYVNRGLLDLGVSDDELAFVLSHELAHVTLQHARKQIEQAQVTGTIIGILTGGDDRWVRVLGQILENILTSGYSRGAETEADREGMERMARAGYRPRAAISFFEKLQKATRGGSVRVFPTHPLSSDRIRNAEEWLSKHPDLAGAPVPSPTGTLPGLAQTGPLEQGQTLPDLVLQDSGGNAVRLASIRGRYTLLYFWDSSVPLTAVGMRSLQRVVQNGNYQVIAVHSAPGAEARRKAVALAEQAGAGVRVLYDSGGAAKLLTVPEVTPQSLLTDGDLRVRGRIIGYPDADSLLAVMGQLPDVRYHPWWVTGEVSTEQSLSSQGRAGLEVQMHSGLATVSVNGVPRGTTPLSEILGPGRYVVQVTRRGEKGVAFSALLRPGRRLKLMVALPSR